MELVPTPTYASYLHRIEATFGAIDGCSRGQVLHSDICANSVTTSYL